MSTQEDTTILLIAADLFPDADVIESAVRGYEQEGTVTKIDIDPTSMIDSDWDNLLSDIQKADRIITL